MTWSPYKIIWIFEIFLIFSEFPKIFPKNFLKSYVIRQLVRKFVYTILLLIITLRFTCGENKICSTIKKSKNISNITLEVS